MSVIDVCTSQDIACMLLNVPFTFVAHPQNFHTWLLALR